MTPRFAEVAGGVARLLEPGTVVALIHSVRTGSSAVERALLAGAPLVISQAHSRAASLSAMAPHILAHAPPH